MTDSPLSSPDSLSSAGASTEPLPRSQSRQGSSPSLSPVPQSHDRIVEQDSDSDSSLTEQSSSPSVSSSAGRRRANAENLNDDEEEDDSDEDNVNNNNTNTNTNDNNKYSSRSSSSHSSSSRRLATSSAAPPIPRTSAISPSLSLSDLEDHRAQSSSSSSSPTPLLPVSPALVADATPTGGDGHAPPIRKRGRGGRPPRSGRGRGSTAKARAARAARGKERELEEEQEAGEDPTPSSPPPAAQPVARSPSAVAESSYSNPIRAASTPSTRGTRGRGGRRGRGGKRAAAPARKEMAETLVEEVRDSTPINVIETPTNHLNSPIVAEETSLSLSQTEELESSLPLPLPETEDIVAVLKLELELELELENKNEAEKCVKVVPTPVPETVNVPIVDGNGDQEMVELPQEDAAAIFGLSALATRDHPSPPLGNSACPPSVSASTIRQLQLPWLPASSLDAPSILAVGVETEVIQAPQSGSSSASSSRQSSVSIEGEETGSGVDPSRLGDELRDLADEERMDIDDDQDQASNSEVDIPKNKGKERAIDQDEFDDEGDGDGDHEDEREGASEHELGVETENGEADGEEEVATPAGSDHDEDADDGFLRKRAEAMEALTRIEIEFARLRDRLYVERMGAIEKERIGVETGTHPELLQVNQIVELRRTKKLELAKKWLDGFEEAYERRRESEEHTVWTWWSNGRAELRSNMLDEAYSKKRKLDREKRAMDRPKEGLSPYLAPRPLPTVPLQHRRRLGFDSELLMENDIAWALRHADVRLDSSLSPLEEDAAWADLERMGLREPLQHPSMYSYDPGYQLPASGFDPRNSTGTSFNAANYPPTFDNPLPHHFSSIPPLPPQSVGSRPPSAPALPAKEASGSHSRSHSARGFPSAHFGQPTYDHHHLEAAWKPSEHAAKRSIDEVVMGGPPVTESGPSSASTKARLTLDDHMATTRSPKASPHKSSGSLDLGHHRQRSPSFMPIPAFRSGETHAGQGISNGATAVPHFGMPITAQRVEGRT